MSSWALVAAALAGALPLTGCDTLGQDFKEFTGGGSKPKTPAQAAQFAVDPYDADKRRIGITAIENAPFGGVEIYVKLYRDMVKNERDPVVKAMAIRGLARFGDPADAMLIMPNLADPNVQVRWEAAKGLQRLHNPAVIPELLNVLKNEDEQSDVRVAVAVALGQYPQDRVFQGLVRALDARELAINVAAEASLFELTGKSFGIDPPQWLAWYNSLASTPGGAAQAFADRQEYMYPTYSRPDLWWEMAMFWTSRNWEVPSQPAGLRPKDEQKTYTDESATTQTSSVQ